ncbi:MAG: SGNH/GDSL hydrolase family protein, partial [Acidimicrobiales bacterium]
WTRYFLWEIAFVALGALVLAAGFLGIRRPSLRRSLIVLLVTVVVSEGINLGAVMITAYSAPAILAKTHSLSELVGQSEEPPIAPTPGPADHGVQAVVLGDSTAAGLGGPPTSQPSSLDRACGRSADAYATDLAEANSWNVENLACSGATVLTGILGPQSLGSLTAPAQLAVAKHAVHARAVFVSIGANDVGWDSIIELCAVSQSCSNAALTAYFQTNLDQFSKNYYQLLGQLADLPGHPRVIVNQYYDPFDPKLRCLDSVGLDATKEGVLVQRLDALNAVIAKGAHISGFESVQPDFSGHEICTAYPYVQGLDDSAPFHPTASGELAIALADEGALRANQP